MDYTVERVELEEQDAAVVRAVVPTAGIGDFLGGVFTEVMAVLAEQGLAPAGPPFGRYEAGPETFEIEAGFPSSGPVAPSGRVVPATLPGGPTLLVLHRGPYDAVDAAYRAAEAWLADNDWQPTGAPWEAYLDGPEVDNPRTIVHMPARPA